MHRSLMIINDYTLIVLFTGEEVIGSDTKPPLHVINKRLRVILKIVRPYKGSLAAPKKDPLDLINTHLLDSKALEKSD